MDNPVCRVSQYYQKRNHLKNDSEYMRQFGMTVDQHPEKCLARVLPPPALNYGPNSKSKQIVSRLGAKWISYEYYFYP
jgi:hypothetical protein